jgi:hypothetical protein
MCLISRDEYIISDVAVDFFFLRRSSEAILKAHGGVFQVLRRRNFRKVKQKKM